MPENHIVIHQPTPELVQFEYTTIDDAMVKVKERLEAFETTAPKGGQMKVICLMPYMLVSKETA